MELSWKGRGALAIDSHRNFPDIKKNWHIKGRCAEETIFAAVPGMVTQRSGYPRQRNEVGRSAGGTEQNLSQREYNTKQDI